jgi:hypothetical protein
MSGLAVGDPLSLEPGMNQYSSRSTCWRVCALLLYRILEGVVAVKAYGAKGSTNKS